MRISQLAGSEILTSPFGLLRMTALPHQGAGNQPPSYNSHGYKFLNLYPMSYHSFFQQIRRNSVALISLAIALASLSYNTWRNEVSEHNRNVRTAGFALIERLAELDEVAIHMRYARNDMTTAQLENSRKRGWVQVIAMRDLVYPMPDRVNEKSTQLYSDWQMYSDELGEKFAYDQVNKSIEALRESVLTSIGELH